MNNSKNQIKTSQVIIIDQYNNFYLEDNKKHNCIAFYGGKKENNETYIEAAVRELKEEINICISQSDLIFLEQDVEKLEHGEFRSNLYLLVIDDNLKQLIENSSRLIRTTLNNFELINKKTMINSENFKRKLLLALNF